MIRKVGRTCAWVFGPLAAAHLAALWVLSILGYQAPEAGTNFWNVLVGWAFVFGSATVFSMLFANFPE